MSRFLAYAVDLGASTAVFTLALAGVAFVIQVAMILRPGYLPNMYVIAWLPFAAVMIAAAADWLWSLAANRRKAIQVPMDIVGWQRVAAPAVALG